MPTDLEAVLAKKLKAQGDAAKEAEFVRTFILSSVIICLIEIVMIFEYPAYAFAVLSTAQ
jgi:hypothetical protein